MLKKLDPVDIVVVVRSYFSSPLMSHSKNKMQSHIVIETQDQIMKRFPSDSYLLIYYRENETHYATNSMFDLESENIPNGIFTFQS